MCKSGFPKRIDIGRTVGGGGLDSDTAILGALARLGRFGVTMPATMCPRPPHFVPSHDHLFQYVSKPSSGYQHDGVNVWAANSWQLGQSTSGASSGHLTGVTRGLTSTRSHVLQGRHLLDSWWNTLLFSKATNDGKPAVHLLVHGIASPS